MGPKFSQRHYRMIAEFLKELEAKEVTIETWCRFFQKDNPRFKPIKFKEVCRGTNS